MRLFITCIIFCIILLFPLKALAHDLQTDGFIQVIMHIDPDDEPIENKPSIIAFEFNDKKSQFRGEICNCILTIKKEGQTIFTQQLIHNNESSHLIQSTANYTFPEKGTYQITVTGSPTTTKAFQPFSVSYMIMVKQPPTPTSPPLQKPSTNTLVEKHLIDVVVVLLGIGSFILLIGAIRLMKQQR